MGVINKLKEYMIPQVTQLNFT